jgi:hypothetical protein
MKNRLVTVLLRVYPAPWRAEYGSELAELMRMRALSLRIIVDVLWNGVLQRILTAEASTLLGLAMMLVIFGGLVWNIAAPLPSGLGWTSLVEDSSITLPRVIVKPFRSEFYAWLLILTGCFKHVRDGGSVSQSGKAAVKASFLAGLPIMVAGVLMLFGILRVVSLGPADVPTTFQQHGFAYTYYSARHQTPGSLNILLAPLCALPQSWIWGVVGGGFGRWISRHIRTRLVWITNRGGATPRVR